MILPFKKSKYLQISDGYWRMFIRWAYHKYLNELYIPQGTKIRLGHGIKDVSEQYNGYGVTVSIGQETISDRSKITFLN